LFGNALTPGVNLVTIGHGNGQVHQYIQQEIIMPKGQQRGNKEAKKPKKDQPPPTQLTTTVVTPTSKGGPTERPKKK